MDTDVLIVGAGPTGLMLANQLVRRGVRPLIIDRHSGPTRETRALGVQARTLEIYQQLGLADRAVELGKRATGANIWSRRGKRARLPLGDIGRSMSPYPFLLILGQDDNERLLGEKLLAQGMAVEWDTELVEFKQERDHVRATLSFRGGGRRDIKARWVAGCDGARSIVRLGNEIDFEGAPYEHVFYVADVAMTGPMVPGELNVYLWRDGFHLFFPMRGDNHWRIAGILPEEMRGRSDVTFDDVIPSVRAEAGGVDFKTCSWFSTYRIHHRRATRFRKGRCFLLGDAAHIHSPVGAQGMNTGLQDAYNLAWKLALVVNGEADEALLDSYAQERIPVARRLLHTTDRAFALIVADNALAGFFRTTVAARAAAVLMKQPRFQRFAFRGISQIGIGYPDSSVSQTLPGLAKDAPRAGDRFPWVRLRFTSGGEVEDLYELLDDTYFNLVVVGQPGPTGGISSLGRRVRVYEVPGGEENDRELARVGIARPSFYLLRPDGYVGLAGTRVDADAIARYVAARLHVRAADGAQAARA